MNRRLFTALVALAVATTVAAQTPNQYFPVQPAAGTEFLGQPAAGMYPVQPVAGTEDPNQRSSRRTFRDAPPSAAPVDRVPTAGGPPTAYDRATAPSPLSGAVDAAPLPAPSGLPSLPRAGARGSVEAIPLLPNSPGLGAPQAVPSIPPAATPNRAMTTPPELAPSGPSDRVAALPKETESVRTPSALLVSAGPQMHVAVEGPETLAINREATYRITLENRSPQPAAELLLRVSVPAWAEIVAVDGDQGQIERAAEDGQTQEIRWALTDVRNSQAATMTCRLVPRKNQPIEFALDWVQMATPVTKSVVVREPKLEVSISGPPEALFGEKRRYAIVVSNPGDGEAENVELSLSPLDPSKEEPLVTKIGVIPAGGRKEIAIEFEASAAGEQTIAAKAVADGGLVAESAAKVLVRKPELVVTASGQPFAYAGAVATYKFRITNAGTASAKDVLAAVALPGGLVYQSGLDGGESADGGIRVPIGALAPGESRDFAFRCEAKTPGERIVEIGARAEGDLFAQQSVTTRIEAVADLKLSVNDPPGPLPVGEEIVYEVTIANRGTKAARDVRVVAQFSDGIEPISAQGVGSRIEAGQVVFDAIASIGPTSETVLKVTARPHAPGHHIFRAQVLCADPETRLVGEDTTQFYGDAVATPKGPTLPASKPFASTAQAPARLGPSTSPAPMPAPPANAPQQLPPAEEEFVPAGPGPAFGPPSGGSAGPGGDFQPN